MWYRQFYLLNLSVHTLSTYVGLLLEPPASPELTNVGTGVMVASGTAAISCHLYRKTKGQVWQEGTRFLQDGPYHLVRHPVYACYGLYHLSLMMQNPSPLNIAIGAGALLSLEATARMEEIATLQRYPGYEAYRQTTPRWIPKMETVKEKTLEFLIHHPHIDYGVRAIQQVFH